MSQHDLAIVWDLKCHKQTDEVNAITILCTWALKALHILTLVPRLLYLTCQITQTL
jgi:hypothetical protein